MLNTERLVDGYEAYEYLKKNNDYIDRRYDNASAISMADIMDSYNESKEVNNFD